MASHTRTQRPGEAQSRRAWFCLKLLGLVVTLGFVSAATIGLMLPGVWRTVFVPTLIVLPGVLMFLFAIFTLRCIWFKAKAKHYATMLKLSTDPRFK